MNQFFKVLQQFKPSLYQNTMSELLSVELFQNTWQYFPCCPTLWPFLCEHNAEEIFFKRVKNKLLQVKQPPWERRRWDWQYSERWCQAHRDLKKVYAATNVTFFSWILGWLRRTYITHFPLCCLILFSDLCIVEHFVCWTFSCFRGDSQKYTQDVQFCCRCLVYLHLIAHYIHYI